MNLSDPIGTHTFARTPVHGNDITIALDDYPAEDRELIAGALAQRSGSADEARTRAFIAKMTAETLDRCTLGFQAPHPRMRDRAASLVQRILGVSGRTVRRLYEQGRREGRSFDGLGGHVPPDLIPLHAATVDSHRRGRTEENATEASFDHLELLSDRGWL
jgi:hypothetical protein